MTNGCNTGGGGGGGAVSSENIGIPQNTHPGCCKNRHSDAYIYVTDSYTGHPGA